MADGEPTQTPRKDMLTLAKNRNRNRNKGGRPRQMDADRQPDGRVRPKPVKPSQDLLDRRTELMAEVIRQFPHAAAARYAEYPDAAWYVGRLYLAGAITVEHKDAAERYRRAARMYEALLMAPKAPHALDMDAVRGGNLDIETEADRARFARAKAAYERYYGVVQECGYDVMQAVSRALRDEPVNVDRLKVGLGALVKIEHGH